ncbi:MAG TPA: NlpC/P60 family protein [Cellvibrio sp.]|nr:NlpC/P60 family protein [Cellvibrio sp.]
MFERAGDVVAAARACIGTPFRHQGRVPGLGLDCAGLGIVAAKAVGIEIKDFSGYPRLPFDGMLKKMFDEQINLKRVEKNDASPGDVLLMRIEQAPQHVAILSYGGYMIHAYQGVGKVVEQRIDKLWSNKIVAVYRFVLSEAAHE